MSWRISLLRSCWASTPCRFDQLHCRTCPLPCILITANSRYWTLRQPARSVRRTDPKHAPLGVGEIKRVVIQEGKRNQALGHPEASLTITVAGESAESGTFTVSSTSAVAALSVSVGGERINDVDLGEEFTVMRRSRGRRSSGSCIQAGIIIAHADLEGGGIIGGFAEFDLPSLSYADTQPLRSDSMEKAPV